MSATQQDLLTLQNSFNQQINELKLELANRTLVTDFSQLQKKVLDSLTGIEALFNTMGAEFKGHVDTQHKEINDRLGTLEAEARLANSQREELQKRLAAAEQTRSRSDTTVNSERSVCTRGQT